MFLVFLAGFFIAAPLVVLYTAGYRYNFGTGRIVQTGVLSIDSTPKGAAIFLDGDRLRPSSPALLKNVLPGDHRVRVEKDGKDSTLQLTRNQRAVCPQNDFPARVGDIPSEEYPGWLYGKLFLDGTPLLTACREIEMRFNITIRLQHQRLGSEIITGILDAGNAESAVTALCELTGTRYRQENREYTMYSTEER